MLIKKGQLVQNTKLHGRKKTRSSGKENQRIIRDIFPNYELKLEDIQVDLIKKNMIELEIGFGFGEHILHQALTNPNSNFIGAEPFLGGIISLSKKIDERKLSNIKIYNGNAIDVVDTLDKNTLTTIYILFPDPWPKKRHHKRRLISKYNLDKFSNVLKKGGQLFIATDHEEYQYWILEIMSNRSDFRWICSGCNDFKSKPYEYPETKYEKKAILAGRRPVYLNFEKN